MANITSTVVAWTVLPMVIIWVIWKINKDTKQNPDVAGPGQDHPPSFQNADNMANITPTVVAWTVLPMVIIWVIWKISKDTKQNPDVAGPGQDHPPSVQKADPLVSQEIMLSVSEQISTEWKMLGRYMGVKDNTLNTIEINHHGNLQEKVYQMLTAWKNETGENATVSALIHHLRAAKLVQLAENISRTYLPEENEFNSSHRNEQPSFSAGLDHPCSLQDLKDRLQDEYKKFLLHGLPWMTGIKMSLEEYYVELNLIKEDEKGLILPKTTIELSRIFESDEPFTKILVEGDPGYGKTTLTLKLCFDFASHKQYINHFDLVLWFPLRNFDGNFDSMLLAAARAHENASSALKIIKEDRNNILLILDGLDELPPEYEKPFISFFNDKSYPFITLLVTSRTGKVKTDLGKPLGQHDKKRTSCDMSISTGHVWDKRFKIEGIDENKQDKFVNQHISKFPPNERKRVLSSLAYMKEQNLLTSGISTCPLFLLMIVLILAEPEANTIHNVATQTELYKQIHNCLIRRHLSKNGDPNASTANLFLGNDAQNKIFVNTFNKFGQLALKALESGNYVFSQETITTHFKSDKCIVDVGILTPTKYVLGFIEKLHYEPVHKSFLEFGAAYYLHNEFLLQSRNQWEETICSHRPTIATAGYSLLFPFLAGLMAENVYALFQAIKPYSAEYTSWFGTLVYTLMEIKINPTVFKSLMPLLPAHWVAKWSMNDQAFSSSLQHTEILRLGLQNNKINQVEWSLNHVVRFPDYVKVQTLILYIGDDLSPLARSAYRNLACNDLHCCFVGCNQSLNVWHTFLSLLSVIEFRNISFHLMKSAFLILPLIHTAVTSGDLMNVRIRWLLCELTENANLAQLIENLKELIKGERIRSLFIVVQPVDSGQKLKHASFLQHHVQSIVSCASQSKRLKCFMLKNYEKSRVNLTVDLADLCASGGKTWNWIELNKVSVQCNFQISPSKYDIKFFDIHDSSLTNSLYNLLQACNVSSLRCLWSQLTSVKGSILPEFVTQLIVVIDECFQRELGSCLSELHNLQFLFLQVVPFKYDPTSYSAHRWLFDSDNNLLSVKGLEIWDVEQNTTLSSELVKAIIKHLEGKPQTRKLDLQYLMISTVLELDVNNPSDSDCKKVDFFLQLLYELKRSLVQRFLQRLDVVMYDKSFIDYMSKFKPNNWSSLLEIFSPVEGFRTEHDFWGMKEDDSYHSRKLHELTPTVFKRFSISFCKVR